MNEGIDLIREVLDSFTTPCIGWSGGRCSTVVLHMALQLDPNIMVVFNDTGIEYREIYSFVKRITQEWNLNLITTKPKMTFKQIQEKYPGQIWGIRGGKEKRRAPACCKILKEYPMKQLIKKHNIDCLMTGIRACESRVRWLASQKYGNSYCAKTWNVHKAHPIMFWEDQQLLQYIEDYQVPICELYQKGYHRLGCSFCPTPFEAYMKGMNDGSVTATWKNHPAIARRALKLIGQETIEKWVKT